MNYYISLVIPEGDDYERMKRMIKDEIATATNIKHVEVRKNIVGCLKHAKDIIKKMIYLGEDKTGFFIFTYPLGKNKFKVVCGTHTCKKSMFLVDTKTHYEKTNKQKVLLFFSSLTAQIHCENFFVPYSFILNKQRNTDELDTLIDSKIMSLQNIYFNGTFH